MFDGAKALRVDVIDDQSHCYYTGRMADSDA